MNPFTELRRRARIALQNKMKQEERPEIPAILLPAVEPKDYPVNKKACSKCGKEFPRGLTMHEKHCKGI